MDSIYAHTSYKSRKSTKTLDNCYCVSNTSQDLSTASSYNLRHKEVIIFIVSEIKASVATLLCIGVIKSASTTIGISRRPEGANVLLPSRVEDCHELMV